MANIGHERSHGRALRWGVVHAGVIATALAWGCGGQPGTIDDDTFSGIAHHDLGTPCPDDLASWPGGICAPRLDKCQNPWELPLVGGGCIAIGPRSCPKEWAGSGWSLGGAEVDSDCEPGELIECPEGFVETEDGAACIPFFEEGFGVNEVPVLGGGVNRVGPVWGEGGGDAPLPDECDVERLAMAGLGCVQIGPRACPRLWDSEAEADCQPGDVIPCPDGFAEDPDGLYCVPTYDECGPGERPVLGGGCVRVVPAVTECPEGPYPAVPDGADDVLYVAADSACTQDCGSAQEPFPSIQAALDAASPGAWVLVGPGNYGEGVMVTRAVHIAGLCPARTVVSGVTEVASEKEPKVTSAGIAVLDASGVEISGVGVTSAAFGIVFVNATDATLHGVEVSSSLGAGLTLAAGSSAKADRIWIHDALPQLDGISQGLGLWVRSFSTIEMTDSLIEDNSPNAVAVVLSAQAFLGNTAVRGTLPPEKGEFSVGLFVGGAGHATLDGCVLEGNSDLAMLVSGSGSGLSAIETVVRGTQPLSLGGKVGCALKLEDGASAHLIGTMVKDSWGSGLMASHPGTVLTLEKSVVTGTAESPTYEGDGGLQVLDGASVTLRGSLIEDNAGTGIMVSLPGTNVELDSSMVRGTHALLNGMGGYGAQVAMGASMTAHASVIADNQTAGLFADGAGAHLLVEDCSVTKTVPSADPNLPADLGSGLWVQAGASLAAHRTYVASNGGIGVGASQAGTSLLVDQCLVRGNATPNDSEDASGILVGVGVQAEIVGSSVRENEHRGVTVTGPDSTLLIRDSLVGWTKPGSQGAEDRLKGLGVVVVLGGAAVVQRCFLTDNRAMAVVAEGEGSTIDVVASVVRDTMPHLSEGTGLYGIGAGIAASPGARVRVQGSLVEGNTMVGIMSFDPGASVEIAGSVVRGNLPTQKLFGYGAVAMGGSSLSVSGCLLETNTEAGIVVAKGSSLAMADTVVRNNLTNELSEGGEGVSIAADPASAATISRCLVVDNATAGLMLYGQGTALQIADSVVSGTLSGGDIPGASQEHQVFGDGVVVHDGGTVDALRTAFLNNTRTGVYFSGAGGSLLDCLITANGFYGLAMEKSLALVQYKAAGNFVFGNATDLPDDLKTDITTSPGGLPVPPPPELFSVSLDEQ